MKIAGFASFNYTDINVHVKNSQEESGDTTPKDTSKTEKEKNPQKLSPEEKQLVAKLQARDAEVRAHEAAHQATGGGLAGGASFEYKKGPDGKMYAVGGEVPIAFKEGLSPKETIANARQIKAAAMAPANPSPQDYSVASSATMMELKAEQKLLKEKMLELQGQKEYTMQAAKSTQA